MHALIAVGLSGAVLGVVVGLLLTSRLSRILAACDPQLYALLGLGTPFLTYGTREAQRFVFERQYAHHSNAEVRRLGQLVWLSMVVGVSGFIVGAIGMIGDALVR